MPSPDGKGIARGAWDAYVAAVGKVAEAPPVKTGIEHYAAATVVDPFELWLWWHLEGGFEGLRRAGMSRSAIYRRLKQYRKYYGVHPDEFGTARSRHRPQSLSGRQGPTLGAWVPFVL